MTQLINNLYESGEWPKDFIEVTMTALKKKPKARKCNDHCTINLIAHAAKVVASISRRRIEKKIEDVLGKDQFGFRNGKGSRDAIGMLRIISERTLDVGEEVCACSPCLKPLSLTILTSSLSYCPYQKDKRAEPGNLLRKRCSLSPQTSPMAFPFHLPFLIAFLQVSNGLND
jgi:hypothetical protein